MNYVLDMTARPSIVVIATSDALEAATVAARYAEEFSASVVITSGPDVPDPGAVAAVKATLKGN